MRHTPLLILALSAISFNVQAFETKAKNAILVDFDTGSYLYTKNHDEQMAPASMSKLMTIYILFNELKKGQLSLDDEFTVSENAWRKGGAASGGSTMFLKIGEKVKVEDLLKGIIIQSGNDACIVVAENISGSEDDFAVLMNETAQKLGLKNSIFANSTGLPDENQRMSAEDLAILARHIISEHEEYYHLFKQKDFTHNGIKQGNRNPLLYSMPDADGLKTGHTSEAGFCLTASALRNGRRLIEVIGGTSSNKERSEEAENLMNYGFREFKNVKIFSAGEPIEKVAVWYGKIPFVEMAVQHDVLETMPRGQKEGYQVKIAYDEPLKAPVKKGDVIGQLSLIDPSSNIKTVDLIATHDVERVNIVRRFWDNLKYYLKGQK